jgi:predicted PurR-regulated permease PerM
MEQDYVRKVMSLIVLALLIVLSFFLLRPILLAIILGILLAFVFSPIYNGLKKYIKSKDLASALVCLIAIFIIVLPMWFLTPIVIDQSIKIYSASQEIDFVTPLQNIFPSIFASDEFSREVGNIIQSFVTKATNSATNALAEIILNFPVILLQSFVVLFTFYFVLRDKEELKEYVKSLLPFSKDVEKKLFDYSRNITSSVIYGQIIIGFVQGIIAGIGFFIFGVPNALFLTLLASLAGILPIIGTALVWIPVTIYLFVAGNTLAAVGVLIFGIISSTVDNFLRPIIVSKRTQIPSSLVLIGMVGGLFSFGILGFILGPLIVAYLLVILELYRSKEKPIFLQPQ